MKTKSIMSIFLVAIGILLIACKDQPFAYEVTDGVPEVYYIRATDPNASDSLLNAAYMGKTICIVGKNLRAITELRFNDQVAELNPSFNSGSTLLVTVPNKMPEDVTNNIYMVNNAGEVSTYPFRVMAPAPIIYTLSNEYASAGEEVVLRGEYLIDDKNTPMSIDFAGVAVEHATMSVSKDMYTCRFRVPEGAMAGAPILVTTLYGTTMAKFTYRDTRGMICNWDDVTPGGSNFGSNGWKKPTVPQSEDDGISGKYMQMGDGVQVMPANGDYANGELGFIWEHWCGDWGSNPVAYQSDRRIRDMVPGVKAQWENMALKFEMCIPKENPWQAGAMQALFTSVKQVANNTDEGKVDIDGTPVGVQNNHYIRSSKTSGDAAGMDLPRALYRPWTSTGSFDTNGEWITVVLPIKTEFIYNEDGSDPLSAINAGSFDNLLLMVEGGMIDGMDCNPIIKIDNLRLVEY